jgi:hypothetical protein
MNNYLNNKNNKIKMKRIIITLSLLLTNLGLFAQCIPTQNNFELMLQHTKPGELKVLIKHTNDGASNFNSNYLIDGLVFAIEVPKTNSNIKIIKSTTVLSPFNLVLVNANTTQQKTNNTISTLVHDAAMPGKISASFNFDTWNELAIINYTGTLAKDENFYIVNCDYGILHPNSYYGNTTTDPWLSLVSDNNEYVQYTPSINTQNIEDNIANNQVQIYPNPVQDQLMLAINASNNTDVLVKITSINGQLIYSQNMSIVKGTNNISIPTQNMVNGNYLLQVADGKAIKYSTEFIKN